MKRARFNTNRKNAMNYTHRRANRKRAYNKRATRPTLLGINHDGPVELRELGAGHEGIVWTVQPENFDSLAEFINEHGGPDLWKITPLNNERKANGMNNRKRANVEDYSTFFIHNLTVPSDVGDPVDCIEDFLGQYFTDVMVNDYDLGAEVGDGSRSMEFFIRDTGHNVNDISYLNEDGDYRPLSEIHTAKRANRKRAYFGERDWEDVAFDGDPIYGSSGVGPDGFYYSFYVSADDFNLVFEAQNEDTMDPEEVWTFEHGGDIPSGEYLAALGDAMATDFVRTGGVSNPIGKVFRRANRKRANLMSLDEALQQVANASFYEDKQITPETDGNGNIAGYRVEDDYSMNTDDWQWTYDQGLMDADSVSETSRLMDHYEYFANAEHIRYHMDESVKALESGQTVTFAYAIVSDADAIFDEETQEYYDADGDPTDDVAGWILTADWF